MPDVFHFTAIMEPKRAEMFERPLRKITDDEVLVKMEACLLYTSPPERGNLADHDQP